MSDTQANIRVNIETQQAQAQLTALQQQITLLQKSMAANAGKNLNLGLGNASSQLGALDGKIINVRDSMSALDRQLAGTSRSFGASFKTMSNVLRKTGTEWDLVKQRASAISAEYKKIGDGAKGMSSVLVSSGSAANQAAAQSAMQMQMFTRALDQAGTAALNWGKNMQWAGRQLMVGFTVPLTIFATIAVKAFQDIERELVNLQRVYGDFTTSSAETERMTQSIKELSTEMANLGFTAKETIAIAADAAATGAVGQDLIDMTRNATQLAALGMITQEQALDTIISMNSAFGVAADELGGVVDYLNAVENQTVLSLGDMTEAIPLVAPVVKGLGGDVKELAVVMTAMREGGIGANEAANALKTGLARLITPTRQAQETAAKFGINLRQIVAENEGDFLGMIDAMSQGLSDLSDLQQQQVLSDVFGKRQFARFGALFENFNKEGSQASRTMDLLGASAEDLARQTDKELGALEESETMKMAKAMEELKMAIAPIGRMVMEFLTPLIEFGTKIFAVFDGMPEGFKKVVGGLAAAVGLVIPGVLMLVGLFANLAGNAMNAGKSLLNVLFGFKGAAKGAESLTLEQLEQQAAAMSLANAQNMVTNSLEMQERAVYDLVNAYNRLNVQQAQGGGGARPPMRFATGGKVPGAGNTDKVPALLTPGEFVVNKSQSQKHSGFLSALNNGSVKGFNVGGGVGNDPKGNLSHGAGSVLVLKTSDPDADAKLDELLATRTEMLRVVQETADVETEAGRRALEQAQEELNYHEEIEASWQRTKDEAAKTGYEGRMEINNSRVVELDPSTNNLMRGGGVSGKAFAADLSRRKDPYASIVSQEISASGTEIAEEQAELVMAARRLKTKMENLANDLPDDLPIADALEGGEAREGTVTVAELERQASAELEAELQEKVDQLEQAKAEGQAISEAEIEEQRKQLEAQKRITQRLEEAERQIVEERRGFIDDGSDPTPEQAKYRADNRADSSKRMHEFEDPSSRKGTRRIQITKNDSSATKGGRVKGSHYQDTHGRKQTDALLTDLEQQGLLVEQKGEEIGEGLMDGIARGVAKNSEKAEKAMRDSVGETIDAANQEAEINSPSRATERVGKGMSEGLAQGVLKNASAPREAAGQVGEQMALEFDQEFEGERVGAEQMDEVERGARGNPPDAPPMGGSGTSQKQSFMRGRMGMAGMVGGQVISMAGMAAMAAEGEKVAGVSKELVGSFTMAAGQINSFAGMLPPMAQGIVAAGTLVAAGMTWAIAKWREGVDEASREAAELGASLGGAADAAKRMANMFGRTTLMERRKQLAISEEERGRYEEFSPMFESEEGQKIIEELKGATSKDRFAEIESYVKNAVVQGFVEGADAELLARAFAEQVGDIDLARPLAESIAEFNKTYETTTDKAIDLAQSRMKAIEDDRTLQRAKKTMADGGKLSYDDASKVLGSSMQGIRDWTTVLEAAREDYRLGNISFEQLIETTNKVSAAQEKLSNALDYALMNNTDSGGVQQALKDRLMAQGYTEDQAGGVRDRLAKEMGLIQKDIQKEAFDAAEKRIRAEAEERFDPSTYTDDIYGQNQRAGDIERFVGEQLTQFSKDNAFEQQGKREEYEAQIDEAVGMVASAISQGMDLDTAEDLAAEIQDGSSVAAEAYTNAMEDGRSKFEAMQGAIAAWNIERDPTNPLAVQEDGWDPNRDIRSRYVDQVTRAQNPNNLDGAVAGMDIKEIEKFITSLEKVQTFGGDAMPQKTKDKRALEMENLIGANKDILGPEMTAMLAPYVADGVIDGMEEGGLKGLGQLADILGGDQDALKAYIEIILGDKSLGEDEIQRIVDNLVYANSRIPTELQIAIGLDLKDPKGKDMDPGEWKALIDETALMANMVQGIDTEEEKALAIQFAFQDGVKRKNLSPAKFRSEFQKVMDLIDEMDGEDFETRKKIMVDIITEMNGEQADPKQVEGAINDLQYKFGKAGVNNIPPTIYAKVIDMKVDASGMVERANEMMRLARAAGSEAGIAEAQELLDAATALNNEADDLGAEYVWGGGGNDGGGGGGGEKEFDEGFKGNYDPKKKWDKYKEREMSNQIGIIGYTEAIRRTTSLTEEQIEALKENEKAFEAWKDAKGNKDKMDQFERDYFKGKYSEDGKSPAQDNANNTRKVVTENKKAERAQRKMNRNDVDYFTQQQLLNDPELMAQYMAGGKVGADALNQATERAMAETTVLDVLERQYEVRNQQLDLQQQQAELAIMQAEYAAEDAVLGAAGTDRATLDQRNAEIASETAVIQKTMIAPIQHQIKLEQDKIKVKQRGMKIYEDEIKLLKKEVESRQRMLEDQKRALELKMRENDMLSHDLTLMGYQEEDINEAYDKRIEALEKVLSINEAIAAQQQSQIGLAQALTSGDIGAAAKAAAEMQQLQAQQAADAYRAQMETNKESAINSLTGQDSGMTREQIEDRQRQLTEEEYQTNLKLRDLEDEIYNYNRLIRNEQDEINIIKDQIEKHNEQIKDYEYQIFEIEVEHLRNLQAEQIANDGLLAQADHAVTLAAREEKIQLAKFERSRVLEQATQDLQLAGLEILEQQGRLHSYNFDMLKVQTKQAKKYWDYMTKGASDVGKIKMPTLETGNWKANYDSYRKAAQQAFATADMSATDISDLAKITPRFAASSATGAVPNNAVNGIIGNTTINNMNNNVNVNAAGANANEVADIVIERLALARLQNTGGPT